MTTGSITSLGIGSGLDLQNILDKLRAVDESVINSKRAKKTEFQETINAYNGVNARLFTMKSDALNLSLQSNFIKTASSVTNEDILNATVVNGIEESSYTIDFTQKAQLNSWESASVSSKNDIMFSEPVTGIATSDEIVTTISETMSIYYGETGIEQQIDINLNSGLSLAEIVEQINLSDNNKDSSGTQLVQASLKLSSDEEYYITLSAVSGGTSLDSQVTVDAGFSGNYATPDTLVSITQNEISMYFSTAAGSTYQQVADLINDSSVNTGVTAAIIDNGDGTNPYQLTLTADDTGEDARITMTNLTLTEITGAAAASLDAMLTVNGIVYRRQSNSAINDIITGVTLNLKTVGETTININSEMSSVKKDIVSLVDGFNDLILYIKGSNDDTDNTSNNKGNQYLSNSNDVNRMISQVKSLISTIIDVDSAYASLANLGLEVNKDGTLKLDEVVLNQAITTNPEAVTSLFIGDSDEDVTGLGDLINDSLKNMLSDQGMVATEINTLTIRSVRVDKDIETATEQLDKRYELMAEEFARLDSYIRQLNSESAYMTSMFDSLTKDDK